MSGTPWTRLDWGEIANGGAEIHPNWPVAVGHAKGAGLTPGDLEGVQLTGGPKHELPRLVFKGGKMVTPQGVYIWTLERPA